MTSPLVCEQADFSDRESRLAEVCIGASMLCELVNIGSIHGRSCLYSLPLTEQLARARCQRRSCFIYLQVARAHTASRLCIWQSCGQFPALPAARWQHSRDPPGQHSHEVCPGSAGATDCSPGVQVRRPWERHGGLWQAGRRCRPRQSAGRSSGWTGVCAKQPGSRW